MIFGLLVATNIVAAGKNTLPANSVVTPVKDSPFYIGIGATMASTSSACKCSKRGSNKRVYDKTNFGGLVRIGYDFNKYLGVELRLLKSQISRKFAKTTHYGIYLKPQADIGEKFNIYGLLGYGHTKIECDYKKKPLYNKSRVSYGAGFKYSFSKKYRNSKNKKGWGVFVDYQNLLHDSGPNSIRSNIFSVGAIYEF
jgi:OOP family OmpA-OmpF porin